MSVPPNSGYLDIARGDPDAFERAVKIMKELTLANDPPMSEYAAYIERVASAPEESPIVVNQYPAHAAVIIETLFNKAKEAVEIVSGQLDISFYGTPRITAAAVDFLRRESTAKIKVLTTTPIFIELHPLFVVLRAADLAEHVTLRQMPEKIVRRLECQFVVADARHFRFEPSRELHQAVAQFNNATFGQALHKIFVELETSAEITSTE